MAYLGLNHGVSRVVCSTMTVLLPHHSVCCMQYNDNVIISLGGGVHVQKGCGVTVQGADDIGLS